MAPWTSSQQRTYQSIRDLFVLRFYSAFLPLERLLLFPIQNAMSPLHDWQFSWSCHMRSTVRVWNTAGDHDGLLVGAVVFLAGASRTFDRGRATQTHLPTFGATGAEILCSLAGGSNGRLIPFADKSCWTIGGYGYGAWVKTKRCFCWLMLIATTLLSCFFWRLFGCGLGLLPHSHIRSPDLDPMQSFVRAWSSDVGRRVAQMSNPIKPCSLYPQLVDSCLMFLNVFDFCIYHYIPISSCFGTKFPACFD